MKRWLLAVLLSGCLILGFVQAAFDAVAEVDGATAFVTRMYEVCLRREPDDEGLDYWVTHS